MGSDEKVRQIVDLTQQECGEYYKHILTNSDEHFQIAEVLADRKSFGSAISHLVLGAEELVKALIVFFDSIGFEIRKIDGINDFFTYHRVRHFFNSSFEITASYTATIEDLLTRYYLFGKGVAYPQTELDIALCKLAHWGIWDMTEEQLQIELKQFIKPYQDENIKCLAFWVLADNWKKQGFYVDYKDGVQSPQILTEKNYEFASFASGSIKRKFNNYISNISVKSELDKQEFVRSESSIIYKVFTQAMNTNNGIRKSK